MTDLAKPINFEKWISDHEHLLRPPVNNKTMQLGDDFLVQVIGGPNQRTDYHVDPYEEWFYQVRGDIVVRVMTADGPRDVHIREGESWLLPRNVPHSPQRPTAGSIGLVLERVREEGTLEQFRWYCLECDTLLHEVRLQVRDIVVDLPQVFERFYADTEARTCASCGALHPGKG
jgi:3-hydroxyanthranilate 3,4-dioxygenase